MRFYGLSSIACVYLPSGRVVDFTDPTNRFAAPDFGDPSRSLPVVDTDNPVDIAWLRKDRWHTDPKRVERTEEEVAFMERAKEEGSVATQVMVKSFAEAAAQLAAQKQAESASAKPTKAKAE